MCSGGVRSDFLREKKSQNPQLESKRYDVTGHFLGLCFGCSSQFLHCKNAVFYVLIPKKTVQRESSCLFFNKTIKVVIGWRHLDKGLKHQSALAQDML